MQTINPLIEEIVSYYSFVRQRINLLIKQMAIMNASRPKTKPVKLSYFFWFRMTWYQEKMLLHVQVVLW